MHRSRLLSVLATGTIFASVACGSSGAGSTPGDASPLDGLAPEDDAADDAAQDAHADDGPANEDAGDGAALEDADDGADAGDAGPTDGAGEAGDDAADDGGEADAADASDAMDGGGNPSADAGPDGSNGDGGLSADRFVTSVVSFTPGPCAGFGTSAMPGVVEGPPQGGGATKGGLDVVSLGTGGEIVVSFAPNAIVDGPGADFIVFENPFLVGGNSQDPNAEPGEISVSDDGTTWTTYPCTATSYPYGACAGWHPVYSAPGNGISPVDPSAAGGDPYDLADVGLKHARFVRIRDKTSQACPDAGGPTTNGFDLDAVSIVNAQTP